MPLQPFVRLSGTAYLWTFSFEHVHQPCIFYLGIDIFIGGCGSTSSASDVVLSFDAFKLP